jgi:outer membrane receptor protein involved in Fe transport
MFSVVCERTLAWCGAVALLLVTAVPVRAQQSRDSTRADGARRIAPIVTTATRAAVRPDELPQRVTTVTRADLERTPANDAVDALKKVAGVDVIQYPSLFGYVSVRGFRPSSNTQTRTLILLDGRPAGSYNLSMMDLSAIEHIEVLKGPASALYGSTAVGGVVNLITRRSSGRFGAAVSATYGTFQRSEVALRAGGVVARLGERVIDADVTARRYDQEQNFRIGHGGVFRDAFGGDKATKSYPGTSKPSRIVSDTAGDGLVRDFSTFESATGSARIGVALPGAFRVDLRGELFNADDVLSPGDVYARLSTSTGDARKNIARHTEDITLRRDVPPGSALPAHEPLARFYTARETSDNFDQPGDAGYVNFASHTRTSGMQVQDVARFAGQSLTVGVDASRIDEQSQRYSRTGGSVAEIGTFAPNARQTSAAVFGQTQLRTSSGRVTGIVGGRLDRVSLEVRETPFRSDVAPGTDRFTIFNPNAGVQVGIGRGVRAHATAGRAFLNPSASSLAGFSSSVANNVASVIVGNPSLRPEHSVTVDGGLAFDAPTHGLSIDATYFDTRVTDRISSARATFPAGRRPTTVTGQQISSITTSVNAGVAHVRGLELATRYDIGRTLRRPFSLGLFVNGTRLFRAEEATPAIGVDTSGIAAVQNLDARVVFDRIRLDPSRTSTVRIKNVAAFTGTAGFDFDDHHRFSGRLAGRYVGHRLDTDFSDPADPGDIEYAASLVIDLAAGARFASRYRIDGIVSNLTDENYYEKRGYNLPGRMLRGRLSAEF